MKNIQKIMKFVKVKKNKYILLSIMFVLFIIVMILREDDVNTAFLKFRIYVTSIYYSLEIVYYIFQDYDWDYIMHGTSIWKTLFEMGIYNYQWVGHNPLLVKIYFLKNIIEYCDTYVPILNYIGFEEQAVELTKVIKYCRELRHHYAIHVAASRVTIK